MATKITGPSETWIRMDRETFNFSTVQVCKSDDMRVWVERMGKMAPVERSNRSWIFFPNRMAAKAFVDAKVAEIMADATAALDLLGAAVGA